MASSYKNTQKLFWATPWHIIQSSSRTMARIIFFKKSSDVHSNASTNCIIIFHPWRIFFISKTFFHFSAYSFLTFRHSSTAEELSLIFSKTKEKYWLLRSFPSLLQHQNSFLSDSCFFGNSNSEFLKTFPQFSSPIQLKLYR